MNPTTTTPPPLRPCGEGEGGGFEGGGGRGGRDESGRTVVVLVVVVMGGGRDGVGGGRIRTRIGEERLGVPMGRGFELGVLLFGWEFHGDWRGSEFGQRNRSKFLLIV